MTSLPLRAALGRLALLALALTLSLTPTAFADGGHASSAATPAAEHGMTADEHAGMTADEHRMTPGEHADMTADEHGMTAEQHADMAPGADSEGAAEHAGHDATTAKAANGEAGAAAGEHGENHREPAAAEERPVGLVLAGFGLVNVAVIVAAAVLRRRPAARKRLATLARVRNAAAKRTVPPKAAGQEGRS